MFKGLLCLIGAALAVFCAARAEPPAFSEEAGLYTTITDVPLATSAGPVMLSELYGKKPLLVALVFTRCSGICSPFLSGLADQMRALAPGPGFRVLVVSFDPRDSLPDMERYGRQFQLRSDDRWLFATTGQIDALTASLGFRASWDSTRQQFDHEALLAGVNDRGRITRKMAGLRDRADLASMLRSLRGEFIPSYPLPGTERLLSCFTFDPVTGERKLSYGMLVLLVPAVLTLFLVLVLASIHRGGASRTSPKRSMATTDGASGGP